MKSKINILLNIGWQILFWAAVLYFFVNYSFLRPSSGDLIYKEYIYLAMIIFMVYFNYLFLIPKYFQKGKLAIYWIITVLSILLVSVGEYLLFKPITINCYPKDLKKEILSHYLQVQFFLCTIKNICFFLFFFVVRLYQDMSSKYIAESRAIANTAHTIAVMKSDKDIEIIKTSDIVYMSHNRNYTYFHMIDGKKYFQYIPLKMVGKLLPQKTFLRISKSNIIMLSKVVGYDDFYVILDFFENDKRIKLQISANYKEEVLPVLEKHKINFPNDIDNIGTIKENIKPIKTKNGAIKTNNFQNLAPKNNKLNSNFKLNLLENEIFTYISEHPNCKFYEISEATNKPKRTLQRSIKNLKELELIEYRGAKKNGGYYIIKKKGRNSNKYHK
ncbi:MAG: LytTR family transcriptional regulator DNA-binding domain-containing protein [Bacteroidales bacterium]|jgi:predicted transcriptional regulator|nr:LytTR family transcriptional regulator DNA-binding domain-containing protein [Bacteroidales bacterium]